MAHPAKGLSRAEELLQKFMDEHERRVHKGASPFSALERLAAKMAIEWVLTRYRVENKHGNVITERGVDATQGESRSA
jgi:hypothetical protein